MSFEEERPVDLLHNKRRWLTKSTLLELLQEIPVDAQLAATANGNLTWMTDKLTGYIDFEAECVQALPDRP